MDETELNGTEALVGLGLTLAGLGVAAHIAVAFNEPQKPKTTPKTPQHSSSMTTISHQ